MKTRRQKSGDSLQVLAADVDRLMSLAYAECPLDVMESLAVHLAAEQNATRRNLHVTCWKCFKKRHVQRSCQENDAHSGKLTYGRLAERRIPILNKAPEEEIKVSALSRRGNGLYIEGSICDIPCLFLVNRGTSITLLRVDLARKLKERRIYTAPSKNLKTATSEKAKIQGKLDACVLREFQHRVYAAEITDSCILGMNFLQKFKFTGRIKEILRETRVSTSGRHFGVKKTLRKTRKRFYWNRFRTDAEKWCRKCQVCRARKGPTTEQGKSKTGWTPVEMFSDRTLRFICDILFGRSRDTPYSPTNSEARLERVQASSARERVKLSRERMRTLRLKCNLPPSSGGKSSLDV
ncbi:hypothetical protein AVEN_241206-1 [Araneus ventricosus]|uniref:RNA-directed DNA polymerase n=1 Tax=Araneus ventricosus TaxID=182803 RepID=A0A4Y2D0I0_ARAVE|nr:hypothetical protein AVEN_241206-1 [Araneus ventricosus]